MASDHDAEIAGFADFLRQRFENCVTGRPHHGRGDDAEPELHHARAWHVAAAARLALQQAFAFQIAHNAMGGRLGKSQQRTKFGDAERAARARHRLENCDGFDGGKSFRRLLGRRLVPFELILEPAAVRQM